MSNSTMIIQLKHEQYLTIDNGDFVITNYYDQIDEQSMSDGKEVRIPFAKFKRELLDSAVFIVDAKAGSAENIDNDTFKMPDNIDSTGILKEVIEMKNFFADLEKSIERAMKDN